MHMFEQTFSKFHNTFERTNFYPKGNLLSDKTTKFYGQNSALNVNKIQYFRLTALFSGNILAMIL